MRLFITTLFLLVLCACGAVPLVENQSVSEQETPVQIAQAATEPSANLIPDQQDTVVGVEVETGLIEELAQDFTWDRHLERNEVSKRIQWYQENPEQFTLLLERSSSYLPIISREIRNRNMPAELAFLPMIESGFQPAIYSRSGAAGLWQLMPATARHMGMRIDWWYDERLNIESSTVKALDYLEYLQKQFRGDWELSITAYNGGEGHVRSRMRRARSNNFWDLKLKNETEQYLPRLLAVTEILSDPDKYGLSIPYVEKTLGLQNLEFDQQIDLRMAAEIAGMDYKALKRLNPDFQRWVSPPRGSYNLLLPAQHYDILKNQIGSLQPDQLTTWDHYRVQYGDTLIDIAREFGTTVRALVAVNELPNSRIYARQELLIPRVESVARISKPDTIKELYIVKRGDSLWEIANDNDLSISELKTLNSLKASSVIHPGQVLVLNEYFDGNETSYKVKMGDSLSVIAHRFKVAIADIRLWNSLGTKDLIHPGQILKIRKI